jgi:hypothetical protein
MVEDGPYLRNLTAEIAGPSVLAPGGPSPSLEGE